MKLFVAPCVGAWIETDEVAGNNGQAEGRSLRGSVD